MTGHPYIPVSENVTGIYHSNIILKGPFYEGDVFRIPFKFFDTPTAVEEPNGYAHSVVLRKIGRKTYRLVGTWQRNPKGNGVVRELYIHRPGRIEVRRGEG